MLLKRSFLLIESLPIFYGSRSRSPSRRKNNLEPVKNIAYHCSQPKRSYAAVRNVLSHASLTSEATYKNPYRKVKPPQAGGLWKAFSVLWIRRLFLADEVEKCDNYRY